MGKEGEMETEFQGNRGRAAVPAIVAILGLLAACAPATRSPAPVVYGGTPAGGANGPPPQAAPPSPLGAVVVQPGQSLSMIARDHHLSWPAIAAANHLSPPYRIQPGQRLVLPASGFYAAAPPAPAAPVAVAALPHPLAPPPERPRPLAALPERPKPLAPRPTRVIALDSPQAPHAAAPRPEGSFARPIPLDNPLAAGREKPAAPPQEAAAPGGGDFMWPVRGAIVEGFGAGPNGTRNEGINIAAPRGAPVRAADAGVVAYVGNELRGYGNLILIKHPQGWISAYAHCGTVLVKRGEKVRRGQVIARIGATGDVKEPQLHFELRHGKKAVDPRPLLGAPARAADASHPRAG
jgi:murein DD-endopeptidase MepM/ murein hydrolase activator NlpD